MAVSALAWKYIGTTTLGGSADIDDTLDAIYTLLNASSYYDGSSRTAGSGVAWSPTKVQDTGTTIAVHCSPSSAASDTCKGMRIIFAGIDTGASANFPLFDLNNGPALEETTGDTVAEHQWLQACLFGGLAKNAGSFNSITAGADTTPFTSGGFTGFARIADSDHFPSGKLFAYECLDAIFIVIQDGSDSLGRSNAFAAGGLIDPGSDAATDSEADEVVYTLHSSANIYMPDEMLDAASNVWPVYQNTNNTEVAVSFSVGSTTYTLQPLMGVGLKNSAGGIGGDLSIKLRSGRRVLIPFYFAEFFDTGAVHHIVGRWREIFHAGECITSNKLTGGGSDLGYFIGASSNSARGQGMLLKA